MSNNSWTEEKEVLLEGLSGKTAQVTSQLLENQKKHLNEAAASGSTGTGNVARFDKVVMPLIRRVAPATIAMDLVGVQPMTAPVGIVNTLRTRYSNNVDLANGNNVVTAGDEANGVNVYDKYSLIAAGTDYDSSDALTQAQQTLALEAQGGYEMNLEIVKQSIEAKTRKLQAKWTIEADQDAKALHGIDIEQEMVAALSDEIVRDQDQELLTELRGLAGSTFAFDMANADGRYAGEKYTALTIGMSEMSATIADKTKRGGASWMVVSMNVLTAMRHANNGSFVPATGDIQARNTLFAGTFNGTIKVYVDLRASGDTILMGYKGASELDCGFVYCPYIPLMQSDVITDPTSYDPRVSLMTRYALCDFTDTSTSLGNSADYYAKSTVSSLSLGF